MSAQTMPTDCSFPGPSSNVFVEDIIKQSLLQLNNSYPYDENSQPSMVSDQTYGSAYSSSYGSAYGSTYDSTWSSPLSSSPPYEFENALDAPWPMVPIPIQATAPQRIAHPVTDDPMAVHMGTPLPSAAELFGFRPNYYPNFDPKEYFCDTVAVDNASMVAQIVGKKGAKIKHLVAKYGTRIRTPNVDQEPVFVIKGKRADVYRVKQEIMSAANHFMRIEQGKRLKLDSVMNSDDSTSMKLFIPARYVGLVIGRNGRIVRDLQTTHQVYVETPKFDLRHYFRIYGTDYSIQCAVQAIYDLLVKKSGICFTERRHLGDEVHFIE